MNEKYALEKNLADLRMVGLFFFVEIISFSIVGFVLSISLLMDIASLNDIESQMILS